MAGEVCFRKVQWGAETTGSYGTPVNATSQILGTVTIPRDREIVLPDDATGRRGGPVRAEIYQYLADPITIALPHAYSQALPAIFEMGLKKVTPSSATGPTYTWTFTPVLSSTGTDLPLALTIRGGDDTQAYVMEYVMARRITISGKAGDGSPISVEAECFGRQVTAGSFTAALSVPTVAPMIGNQTTFYVDTNWAGLGGTAVAGVLKEWKVEIQTGLHPRFYANGQLYFASHGKGIISAQAQLTFEGNATADSYFDLFQAKTPKAIRIKTVGSQIGAGGYNTLQIDLYGVFTEVIPLGGEEDNDSLHTAVFQTLDDNQSTPHNLQVTVITSIKTI